MAIARISGYINTYGTIIVKDGAKDKAKELLGESFKVAKGAFDPAGALADDTNESANNSSIIKWSSLGRLTKIKNDLSNKAAELGCK